MSLTKFHVGSAAKKAGYRAPSSSEDYNELQSALVSDLLALQEIVNEKLVPLLDTLPGGTTTIGKTDRVDWVDAFKNGLDASQFYVDNNQTANDSYSAVFWDSINKRPKTVKESLRDLFVSLNKKIEEIKRLIDEKQYTATIAEIQNNITSLQLQLDNIQAEKVITGRATFTAAESVTITGLGLSDSNYSIHLTPGGNIVAYYLEADKTGDGFIIYSSVTPWTGTVCWTVVYDEDI